jgi:hypothetical protein
MGSIHDYGGDTSVRNSVVEATPMLDSEATTPVPASDVLQRLHDQAPADHFTPGWLLTGLSKHSFGILLLLLAVIAIAPGASIVAGVLLLCPWSDNLRQMAV